MGSAGSVLQRQGSGRWRQLHCSAPSARQRAMRRAPLQRRRFIVSRPTSQRGRPGAWFGRMRRRMLMTPSTRCTNAGRTVAAFKQLGSSLVCRRAMGCAVFMGLTKRMLMTPSKRCTNAGRTVAAFKQLGSSLVCRRAMGCAACMGLTKTSHYAKSRDAQVELSCESDARFI